MWLPPLDEAFAILRVLRRPSVGGALDEDPRTVDDMSTLQYDLVCGPQQLAKYLTDMRMLVMELEEADYDGTGAPPRPHPLATRLGPARSASPTCT